MNKERDIGFLIKKIQESIKRKLDAELARYELTVSQSRVLFYIHCKEDHKASVKEIEAHLQVTHPTVIGIVKRLEDKGFVNTKIHSKDRRVKLVTLTDKSIQIIGELERGKKKMDGVLMKGLTEEEQEEFRRLLLRVQENLEDKKEERIC